MTTPKTILWKLEPHTKAKHEVLRRYLGAWFPILRSNDGRMVYFDGFCGPGTYVGDEDGSPLIALKVATGLKKKIVGKVDFIFIDDYPKRIELLKSEVNNLQVPSNFNITIECGRFREKFEPFISELAKPSKSAPTFAMIDPFGFRDIPINLIKRLLKINRCEALITFMIDSMNRFVEHPDEEITKHIVDAFGTDECIKIAKEGSDRIVRLGKLYQRQLSKFARFVRYFEMRDKNDRTIYYLFFVSNNKRGHVKMKDAMWAVDANKGYSFSDATNPNQTILFNGPHNEYVFELIKSEFSHMKLLTVDRIREYIENETGYLSKHMRSSLKWAEAKRLIQVEDIKSDGKARRKGTFPDEVKFCFQD